MTTRKPPGSAGPEAVSRRIGARGFALVNVLSRHAYEQRRIPGSVSLPLDEIRAGAREVLPDLGAEILVYCASGS